MTTGKMANGLQDTKMVRMGLQVARIVQITNSKKCPENDTEARRDTLCQNNKNRTHKMGSAKFSLLMPDR
jgi:hypothetical protein